MKGIFEGAKWIFVMSTSKKIYACENESTKERPQLMFSLMLQSSLLEEENNLVDCCIAYRCYTCVGCSST
ncbi:hypothetical protein C5167_022140 [Papaver somniferum]|uniref:Uncharacterized protein n=1 Tax=Papaver somniferum TaxID=3469 RepID=A0A4Y7JK86_PAPSO|nr:hypothetical protein C5167_022140 [Papaver somniferum]